MAPRIRAGDLVLSVSPEQSNEDYKNGKRGLSKGRDLERRAFSRQSLFLDDNCHATRPEGKSLKAAMMWVMRAKRRLHQLHALKAFHFGR